MPPIKQPTGYAGKPGYTKIAISLSHATFARVLARAKAENRPFSETLEDTLLCGLLCLDESDAHEQPGVTYDRQIHS